MITADLVFAQVSTEHPLRGYFPSVTFLGTRFDNLRISGREVEPVFDLDICGPKPAGDRPYLQNPGFLNRASQQYARINSSPGLSDAVREQYHGSTIVGQTGKVECSLVTNVAQTTPGTSIGHVVEVAGLGNVSLANLSVDGAFTLTMVSVNTNPSGGGNVKAGGVKANGNTKP